MKQLLIEHKFFEESLEKLVNESNLPAFIMADIMDRATEKLKHTVTVQTIAAIQEMQANQAEKEEEDKSENDNTKTQSELNTRESAAEG